MDVWLVGDTFLRNLWATVLTSQNKAVARNVQLPYLYHNFNVIPCYPGGSSMTRSVAARFLNEIIKTMNDSEHMPLPKFLLIMPDKDLVEAVHHGGFECKLIFEKILHWLMTSVEAAIHVRIEDLQSKKGGVLLDTRRFPKVIWFPMLTRPFINDSTKGLIFVQCAMFNAVLKSAAA